MGSSAIVRILRPNAVLHYISLPSAAEFISYTLLVNKVSGLYGVLAVFTGYHLNPLQVSHYIYSLIIFALGLFLMPAIRRPDQPLKVLCLSWLYVLDALVNSVYTALFGATWFIILAQHFNGNENAPNNGGEGLRPFGADTINETAGFTDPEHDVSHVEVVAKPASGLMPGQEAVAYGRPGGILGAAIFESGSIASISIVCILWLLRIYLCLIMLSYARSILRQYIRSTTSSYSQSDDPNLAENPFRVGRDEGQGVRGALGRALLKLPTKGYWLGKDDSEDEWLRVAQGRFGNSTINIQLPERGVRERERRARSGTGPPRPSSAKAEK